MFLFFVLFVSLPLTWRRGARGVCAFLALYSINFHTMHMAPHRCNNSTFFSACKTGASHIIVREMTSCHGITQKTFLNVPHRLNLTSRHTAITAASYYYSYQQRRDAVSPPRPPIVPRDAISFRQYSTVCSSSRTFSRSDALIHYRETNGLLLVRMIHCLREEYLTLHLYECAHRGHLACICSCRREHAAPPRPSAGPRPVGRVTSFTWYVF